MNEQTLSKPSLSHADRLLTVEKRKQKLQKAWEESNQLLLQFNNALNHRDIFEKLSSYEIKTKLTEFLESWCNNSLPDVRPGTHCLSIDLPRETLVKLGFLQPEEKHHEVLITQLNCKNRVKNKRYFISDMITWLNVTQKTFGLNNKINEIV